MPQIPILTIRFHQEISTRDIPLFRGAVIASMENADILFHNHDEDNFRYSYPLIQYKRIAGKAAIVCIGEGVERIGEFFSAGNFLMRLGDKEVNFDVMNVKAENIMVQIWDSVFTFRINHWLPLNQQNHEIYAATDGLADKYAMLERLLTGNILSFAKSQGLFFTQEVNCKIIAADNPVLVPYKGVKMQSFNAVFKTNVSLPLYIGLGKGVSIGHGIITKYVIEK